MIAVLVLITVGWLAVSAVLARSLRGREGVPGGASARPFDPVSATRVVRTIQPVQQALPEMLRGRPVQANRVHSGRSHPQGPVNPRPLVTHRQA